LLTDGVSCGWVVDCTLGGGGHSEAILNATPSEVCVLGIDRDPDAREVASSRLSGFGDRFKVCAGRFGDVAEIVSDAGVGPVAGMLFDLGVSSAQLDRPERGFSFRFDGPLDMDMERRGEDRALAVLEGMEWRQLAQVLGDYGEVPRAGAVARAIVRAVSEKKIQSTGDLANLIEKEFPWFRKGGKHPATRVFQAIRIQVNDEVGELEGAVAAIPTVLADGGVAAMISYHSGEDRMVKHGFRALVREGGFELPFRRPVLPEESEINSNPRARSAKLRAIRKVSGEVRYA